MRLKNFHQLNEENSYSDYMKEKMTQARHSKVTDTLIKDESISGIEDIEWIDVKECDVYWDYELNVASWGINYIMPTTLKVILSIDVYTYNETEDKDGEVPKEYEFTTENAEFEEVNYDTEGTQTVPFAPKELEISHLETSEDNKVKIKIIF